MSEPSQNSENESDEMNGNKKKNDDDAIKLLVNDKWKERESLLVRLSQVEDFLIDQGELKRRTKKRGAR